MTDKSALRDAATVILLRTGDGGGQEVLMGQRGRSAAFMPGKFVFPGGAVDAEDAQVPLAGEPDAPCMDRLGVEPTASPQALLAAAVRELWEETGLRLGAPGAWSGDVPPTWSDFAQAGLVPDPRPLRFVFRAVTPPGRPRRFDARFFLAPAEAVLGGATDFSGADGELSFLQWVPLARAREFDLPFITRVVLAELSVVTEVAPPANGVPFVINDDVGSRIRRIV